MSERQIQLEKESVTLGQVAYHKRMDACVTFKTEDITKPSISLIKGVLSSVAEAIEIDRTTPRRGKTRGALHLFASLESETLAWHGLRCLLSSLTQSPSYTKVVMMVGASVMEELNFRRFAELEAKSYKMTQQHLAQAKSGSQKRGIMKKMFSYSSITPVAWSKKDQAQVGVYIISMVLQITGWATVLNKREGAKRQVRIIHAEQDLMDWLIEAHASLADLAPLRMPMVCQPLPWSNTTDGGYLTDLGGQIRLVKSFNHGYIDALDQVDMPEVYAALNAIQETPWKVNTGVLQVAQAMWEEGAAIGKRGHESLPPRDALEIPPFPAEWSGKAKEWKEADPAAHKLWAQRAAVVHDENRRLISKRLSCIAKMNVAEKFAAEPEIFFPHNLDFRMRVYPIPHHLNPQGDDLAKALIHLAEGKRLGADGASWLKIHIANCFGIDKVSFDQRIRWTEGHLEELLDSAIDPIDGMRFWATADSPFTALAACYELMGFCNEGIDYVSHLQIPVDGSCNGLQNFSALLRDEVGGKATNLVPQDEPADIYSEVADLVAKQVKEDAEGLDKFALMLDGFITRFIVKHPVMTQPYGATRSGMQNQIEAAIKKIGNPMGIQTVDMWGACAYLAKLTYDAIGQVVIAARAAMDWLQEVARKAAAQGYPIRWTTPVGFPVLQEYRKVDAERIRIHLDGQRAELYVNHQGTQLDRRRQATGISPNLIHSLDASHMMKTIVLAQANGIKNFAMIHDSFGCHACDIPMLNQCIRTAFIEQYSVDVLGKFKADLEEQLPLDIDLPPLPPFGNLDLSVIEDSLYFFA